MSTQPPLPPSEETFTAPVNEKTRKASQEAVATALGLDKTGTRKVLSQRINAHLKANPHLAREPRFRGLFSGRPSNPAGVGYRKSTDKEAEDGQAEADGGSKITK
jgi:hypothetical protein